LSTHADAQSRSVAPRLLSLFSTYLGPPGSARVGLFETSERSAPALHDHHAPPF